jgi:hypothetical protein
MGQACGMDEKRVMLKALWMKNLQKKREPGMQASMGG